MLGFFPSFSSFREEGEIFPNLAQKCDAAVIRRFVVAKRRNIYKWESVLSKEG